MDDQIHIKLEWEDAIRRATVPRTETLSGLKRTVNTLLGLEACDLTYTDEEGDLITVGSDLELRQLLDSAAAEKRTLRIKVKSTSKTQASTPAEQVDPEPEEPKYPFAELAKALSEAETVERIQATFQSPVITEAINRFARAYTETGGDVAMSGLVASQSLPALMGLLAGLVQELPILADLQDLLVQQFIARGPPPFAQCIPPAAAAAFGRPPFGPGCGAGPGGMGQGHFGVFCDGCTSDAALKQVAQRDGHMTHRGFIRGTRFKSESVHDFDLCESCMKNTARFPESAYGPFTAVAPPADGQRGPKRCWGWQRRHGGCGPDHHSWRHHGHHRGPHHPDHHHREHPHPDHHHREHPHPDHHHREHPHPDHHHHEHPHPDHHHEHHHPGHHHHHEHAPKDEDQRGVAQGEAVPPAKVWEDIMSSASVGEAIRKGSEAFFGNQTNKNELNDIVQAIAESLKEVQLKATEAQVDSPGAETKVVPPTAPEDPFVKWAQQLRQLQTLGFDRLETYIELLEEEKGDLERVVNRIVRRDM